METHPVSHFGIEVLCIIRDSTIYIKRVKRLLGFPGSSEVKILLAVQEMQVRSLGQEDPLEEDMATHSSIPAWRIPWTEEPDKLWSMGLQRV